MKKILTIMTLIAFSIGLYSQTVEDKGDWLNVKISSSDWTMIRKDNILGVKKESPNVVIYVKAYNEVSSVRNIYLNYLTTNGGYSTINSFYEWISNTLVFYPYLGLSSVPVTYSMVSDDTMRIYASDSIASISIITPSGATDSTWFMGGGKTLDGFSPSWQSVAPGNSISLGYHDQIALDSITIASKAITDIIRIPIKR